ncbi:MAG: glycosyltransferase family 9 protein [Rhodocyclaceae bacterium]|nr:glycosyltransferase family 9 protein [Rhodocyclaceae bacterium]
MPSISPRLALADDARFLVIRRDNIGDLLCTTPLIRALRQRYPAAWIGALVNSYNAPVLAGNRDLDAVHAYEKLKHLAPGRSRFGALVDRLRLIRGLRARRIDCAILAAPGHQSSALRFARLAAPRHILGHAGAGNAIDISVDADPLGHDHEVEACFRLLQPLGIDGPPPPMSLAADAAELAALTRRAGWSAVRDGGGPLIGLHISARKAPQRWPIARFAALAERLHAAVGARFLLFWAPGSSANPLHPGDDEAAQALAAALPDVPLLPVTTARLPELIAGLSLCDQVICSDGGAMHIAAALGKPLVCFFGNSDAARWHPWGVPYELLQAPSRDVSDVTTDEAFAAWQRLQLRLAPPECAPSAPRP